MISDFLSDVVCQMVPYLRHVRQLVHQFSDGVDGEVVQSQAKPVVTHESCEEVSHGDAVGGKGLEQGDHLLPHNLQQLRSRQTQGLLFLLLVNLQV